MSASPLVSKKRVRIEFYIAPGVSVTNPAGPSELEGDTSLEALGNSFLQEVKDPASDRSAMDTMTAEWAVLRSDGQMTVFGFPTLPIGDTGLFNMIQGPNDQLTLVPAGHPTVKIGRKDVEAPSDMDPSGCCVMQ